MIHKNLIHTTDTNLIFLVLAFMLLYVYHENPPNTDAISYCPAKRSPLVQFNALRTFELYSVEDIIPVICIEPNYQHSKSDQKYVPNISKVISQNVTFRVCADD